MVITREFLKAEIVLTMLKRKTLKDNLADLCKKYEAAHAQIRSMLSEVDKISMQNRIRQLEQEIQETEQQLNSLV